MNVPMVSSGVFLRARDELVGVHRDELARSLCTAARLRIELRPDTRLYLPALDLDAALRRWTRRVERTLGLLASDGIALPDAELLELCLRRPLEDWPEAERLAEASLLARDGLAGRVRLAQVALTAGAAGQAADVLQRVIATAHLCRGSRAGAAFEWLAYAHEALGRDRLALGACEQAGHEPAAPWDPLLSGLVLALRTGDERRARWFRAELHRPPECSADRSDAGLGGALDRLRARIDCWRGSLGWRPTPAVRAIAAELRGSPSRAEREAVGAAWSEPRPVSGAGRAG